MITISATLTNAQATALTVRLEALQGQLADELERPGRPDRENAATDAYVAVGHLLASAKMQGVHLQRLLAEERRRG